MKVIKAKTAGFCFGVKRAVDTVYEQVNSCEGPIYTLGPIIHNEEVVKDMESKGVLVLRNENDLDALERLVKTALDASPQVLPVVVNGNILANALAQLPEGKRDVILLSYFLGMTDREISEKLNIVHQTVSKRRRATLKELREYLVKEGFEWPDE